MENELILDKKKEKKGGRKREGGKKEEKLLWRFQLSSSVEENRGRSEAGEEGSKIKMNSYYNRLLVNSKEAIDCSYTFDIMVYFFAKRRF